MPHDMMTRCERRTKYKSGGEYEWRWKESPVAHAIGSLTTNLRCLHCHGEVRLHRRQAEDGPEDHVQHRWRKDSEACEGGHYFKGVHQASSRPIT